MVSPGSYRLDGSGWTVAFDAAAATLDCRHEPSSARMTGSLAFQPADSHAAWTIAPPRDGSEGRLSLLDGSGDVQGYAMIDAADECLRLHAVHRAAQSYRGVLRLRGVVTLGKATFACRTTPRPNDAVVQMASGPADSALNDSLFDPDLDTAVRFQGDTVAIASSAAVAGGLPTFKINVTARPEDAGCSTIAFQVERDYYRRRYVPHYSTINRKRCPSPPTGWMSWNVYFDQAGEKENLTEARIGAEKLQPFGLEIWSIESWQANSDKLPVRDFHNLTLEPYPGQFPHGMKWLADQIRKLGFRPGIWTVPFGTGSHDFYRAHKEWFLHGADGTPMTNWCGLYLLDPSIPAVRDHMRETHRRMSADWGYEFFKIDGMSGRSGGYSAHFYERDDVRAAFRHACDRPFELCVKALREGIGNDRIFLACQGHYSGPDVLYADAGRIGGDIVSPNQPPKWHNILSQARATLAQLFVHNIVWYSDPDTLLVGAFHTTDVARIATTVVALPGQMMFAGDELGELSDERMRLLQQALPVCGVRPLDLFPIFELKPVWDLKIRRPFADWDVVAMFNWSDEAATVGFRFADLGLPGDQSRLAFEFWAEEFLGACSGEFSTRLAPRSSALLALHRDQRRPQFLSTDRHVTQGGISLRSLAWDADALRLAGASDLVAGHKSTLFFHVPDGYTLASAEAKGAGNCTHEMRDRGMLALNLERPGTGLVEWALTFRRTD